jgi:hypothetical protein
MTTKRKSAPKTESTVSVEERLVEALAHKTSSEDSHPHHEVPSLGDQVTIGKGDSIWSVSRVSTDGREVNLEIPGTNLERFRVNVDDLNFVERTTRHKPKEPEKLKINAAEVRKRFTSARQKSTDELAHQIELLKKFLKNKGVQSTVSDELDELRMDIEDKWSVALESLNSVLGEG